MEINDLFYLVDYDLRPIGLFKVLSVEKNGHGCILLDNYLIEKHLTLYKFDRIEQLTFKNVKM